MYDTEKIKAIPIQSVLEWLGFKVHKSGSWLSVKGDRSIKANVQKNNYIDFSSKLGKGSTIDLVMQVQKASFKDACQMLNSHFYLGAEIAPNPYNPTTKTNTVMKKYISEAVTSALINPAHYERNSFYKFLKAKFNAAKTDMQRFKVGTNRDGQAVFLFFNKNNQCEYLKCVSYNNDGKRTSNIITPEGYRAADGYVQECFFNEYAANDADTVFIVESEKTAIIASLTFPNLCFIATGGASKLSLLLKAKADFLSGKKVVLLPDNDKAGQDWINVKKEFADTYENISLYWLDKDTPEGTDLADLIINDPQGDWRAVFSQIITPSAPPKPAKIALLDIDFDNLEPEPVSQPVSQAQEFGKVIDLSPQRREPEPIRHVEQMPDYTELFNFFEMQVLPDEMRFYNNMGECFAVSSNPSQTVYSHITVLKECIATNNIKIAKVHAYHLERIKDSLTKGSYLREASDEPVPF